MTAVEVTAEDVDRAPSDEQRELHKRGWNTEYDNPAEAIHHCQPRTVLRRGGSRTQAVIDALRQARKLCCSHSSRHQTYATRTRTLS
jgi:hypothetical protein